MQSTTELDAAILAYRENPSQANRLRVLRLQEAQNAQFAARQVAEYMAKQNG